MLIKLSSLPTEENADLLRRLRHVSDPLETLCSIARSSLDTLKVSEHATAKATLPHTQSRLEYELWVSHPSSYRTMGLDVAPDIPQPSTNPRIAGSEEWKVAWSTERLSPESRPSRPPVYVDSRLERLNIAYWTKVPITNEFAASVLSLYLETDHPVVALFDADLFLADLVGQRFNFCSPLLVCSLLFWACVSRSPASEIAVAV